MWTSVTAKQTNTTHWLVYETDGGGGGSLTVTFQCRTETSGAEMSQRRNGQRLDGGAETVAPKCHVLLRNACQYSKF